MAYTRGSRSSAPAEDKQDWKADGFLNFYIPTKGGSDKKVGAIALRLDSDSQKQLIEWLEKDPANIDKFKAKLKITYQSATPSEGSGFDLD